MTLLAFLDTAAAAVPTTDAAAQTTALVLLGGSGLTIFCTVTAFVLRRVGTRSKAVTPEQLAELEKRKPRLAAAIVLTSAFAWDLAQIFEALPALFYGRPMGGGTDDAAARANGQPPS